MLPLIRFLVIVMFFITPLFADYYDSGMKEFKHPDGTTFTGRGWGDEFEFQYETQDGYRFVKGADGYYYFAILNEKGEFVPSDKKVAIDPPLQESYKLERSQERLTEIQNERNDFKNQLQANQSIYFAKSSAASTVEYHLAVICVRFADYGSPHEQLHTKEIFEQMLFSEDYWIDPDGSNNIHPQSEWIYGSMRDFHWQQSLGNVLITGEVVNPIAYQLVPEWIELPENKDYYDTEYTRGEFADTVVARAVNAGWMNPEDYDNMIIIYADERYNGTLAPGLIGSSSINGWIMFEAQDGGNFAHIGVHCHEFGHILGASDQYTASPDPDDWSLMSYGDKNGIEKNASCPAGFAPFWRIYFGWLQATTIDQTTTLTVQYNYDNPVYYRINSVESDSEYFFIENRLREGFDYYTPNDPREVPNDPLDPNENLGGLLIWHFKEDGSGDIIEEIELADRAYNSIIGDHGDPFPYGGEGAGGNEQDFNDGTWPYSKLRDGSDSYVAINNIHWNDADKTTTVDIDPLYNVIMITENTNWNGTIELTQNVIVDNAQLTIDAGTELILTNSSEIDKIDFKVKNGGSINFNGSEIDSIIVYPTNGKWGGIIVEEGSSVALYYTRLQDIDYTLKLNAENSTATIENCLINNSNEAVTDYGILNIENSKFNNCGLIWIYEVSILTINNSSFKNTWLKANEIESGEIKNSLFISNGTETAMWILYALNFYVENNVFDNYSTAFKYGNPSKQVTSGGGNTTFFKNNIITNCSFAVDYMSGYLVVSYNDFFQNSNNGYTGDFALFDDPKFFDSANENYHLRYESPLIDKGDPASDFSNEPIPNGGRINIGRYGNTAEATITTIPGKTIAADTTWSEDTYISGDITVNESATLTIQPGVNVVFIDNYDAKNGGSSSSTSELIINGRFTAEGTDAQHIIFKSISSSPAYTDWYGIRFYDTAEDLSKIKYCEISDAYYGIYINRASPSIEYNNISHCKYGIYTYYAVPRIKLCNINDISGKGIYVFNSNAITGELGGGSINNNRIENCKIGVYLYRSSPRLHGNELYNNYPDGLYCRMYSDAMLGDPVGEVNGCNIIDNSPRYNIYAYYYSDLFLGDVEIPIIYGGLNSITNNGDYAVRGNAYCIITAEYNWWDVYPVPSSLFNMTNGSSINYNGALNSPPTCGEEQMKLAKDLGDSLQNDLIQASTYRWQGNYTEALSICNAIIQNQPDSEYAQKALAILASVYRLSRKNGFLDRLTQIINAYPQYELSAAASEIAFAILAANGNFTLSIARSNWVREHFSGTEKHRNVLFDLWMLYTHDLGDQQAANAMLAEMQTYFSGDELLEQMEEYESKLPKKTTLTTSLPETYKLFQNYPNPFNPTTNIVYDLPRLSSVVITIYNQVGQNIFQKNHTSQPAGNHRIQWHGANQAGISVSSGLYFVHFKANSLEGKKAEYEKFIKIILLR